MKFKFLQPGLLHWHKRDGNSVEHMLRGTYVWSMCFNARGEREEEGGSQVDEILKTQKSEIGARRKTVRVRRVGALRRLNFP